VIGSRENFDICVKFYIEKCNNAELGEKEE